MFGIWCWETPGAQSDLPLPFLTSLSFPSLPHQYMTTNDSWNFCMQEYTHVKCFWLHDDLSLKVASCKSFCPRPMALVGVSTCGAAVRLSEKSQGGQAESVPGCSISLGPPKVPCTGGEPVSHFSVPPWELSAPGADSMLRAPLQGHLFGVLF